MWIDLLQSICSFATFAGCAAASSGAGPVVCCTALLSNRHCIRTTVATSPDHPSRRPTQPAAVGQPTSFPRLVADIGGTNARFGWIAAPGAAVAQVQKLAVPDFAGPAEAAQAYLAGLADLLALQGQAYQAPRQAAFAVATAVAGDRINFTNSHWDFSRVAVQARLGLDGLLMLNDFESLALSLPRLGADQLRSHPVLQAGAGAADGNSPGRLLAVVGPGTGLGVGAVVATRSGWVALPGEGGHATLAPADDLESAVLAAVRRHHAHVSAEHLLSGIGLPLLYQALGQVLGQTPGHTPGSTPTALTTAQIVAAGEDGSNPLCGQTLDLFCALLGGFAGNVALTLGARGGLFIGGGIVPRFEARFFASAFRQRFEAKGRFRDYLAAIPTALITDTLVALSGAALAIEQQVALAGA